MKRIALIALIFISLTANAQIKVACVGNSITYGAGIENREIDSYPAQLQKMLGKAYIVQNYGRSGATLLSNGHNPYIKTDEFKAATASASDIVIIHLGLNDTDPRDWPNYRQEFRGDYIALINKFKAAAPDVRIIIARMTPLTHYHSRFRASSRVWHSQIQAEIEAVADAANVELIDFEAPLLPRPDLLPDAIHPNAKGAGLLAKTVYGAITGDMGGLQMGPLYTENMVLQMGEKTRIAGVANVGEDVTVTIDNKTYSATTNKNGKWEIFAAIPQPKTGLTLKIVAKSGQKSYANVAIGQVWILSGQSNMSMPVSWCEDPKTARSNPNIRLYKMTPEFEIAEPATPAEYERVNNLDYIRSKGWKEAEKSEIDNFSAIGYYFAQMVADTIGVPIGLIQTSLGGAPTESFVSRKRMQNTPWIDEMLYNPAVNPIVDQWVRDMMISWLKGAKSLSQRHSFDPCYLYESRILPIKGTTTQGVLWYQGESNSSNAEIHSALFPQVVGSFRDAFDDQQLPFYFVQLSTCDRPSWPHFWKTQQELARKVPYCKMVISNDYGDSTDVHPRRKQPVAERLAKIAIDAEKAEKAVKFINADSLPLFGKGGWQTESRYQRLPSYLKGAIREQLWYLGTQSAGLYIRFATNSPFINARWSTTYNNSMAHMSQTGTKGMDLYTLRGGRWVFTGSAIPTGQKSSVQITSGIDSGMHEYMLYMPLYDNMASLEIGVAPNAIIAGSDLDSPITKSPIVFYGTSITQGACASRPAMSYCSILSRRLNRQAINLGFSGNGRLDVPIAKAMGEIENPAILVLDFAPNCSGDFITEEFGDFYSTIRAAHPKTPIVIVENYTYPRSYSSSAMAKMLRDKNSQLKAQYEKARKTDKNLHYVPCDNLIGEDGDATVDNIHATDLGFARYADFMEPILRKLIK